jgi:hypothetical protein
VKTTLVYRHNFRADLEHEAVQRIYAVNDDGGCLSGRIRRASAEILSYFAERTGPNTSSPRTRFTRNARRSLSVETGGGGMTASGATPGTSPNAPPLRARHVERGHSLNGSVPGPKKN